MRQPVPAQAIEGGVSERLVILLLVICLLSGAVVIAAASSVSYALAASIFLIILGSFLLGRVSKP